MRISDWSSDVCSSDLAWPRPASMRCSLWDCTLPQWACAPPELPLGFSDGALALGLWAGRCGPGRSEDQTNQSPGCGENGSQQDGAAIRPQGPTLGDRKSVV